MTLEVCSCGKSNWINDGKGDRELGPENKVYCIGCEYLYLSQYDPNRCLHHKHMEIKHTALKKKCSWAYVDTVNAKNDCPHFTKKVEVVEEPEVPVKPSFLDQLCYVFPFRWLS